MSDIVSIEEIKIGNRYRKDLGNIDALVASIKRLGLLQPIGVDSEYNLIFGERRLLACKNLKWKEVPVRVLNIPDLLRAENDENIVRKDFTPSERVAIGTAIEEQLGNRQGQRTDKELLQNFAEVKTSSDPEPIRQNFAELPKGKTTREIAAEKAGFGNPETYRQAKHVVDHAPQEITDQMDQGDLSINKAYQVTKQLDTLPEEKQGEVVQFITTESDPSNDLDLTEEQQKELNRLRNFKTNVERLIDKLARSAKHPAREYFQGMDNIDWAFERIEVFAEAKIELIDMGIAWLKDFREEYVKQVIKAPREIRRVK